QNDAEGDEPGNGKCERESPARASGVTNKEIGKPDRHGSGAKVDKETQCKQIANERQVPVGIVEKILDEDDQDGEDQVSNQERDGMCGLGRGSEFENGQQRQNDDNRARENDLPLKMAAIGLMGAHARGMQIPSASLASTEEARRGTWSEVSTLQRAL